MKLTLYQILGVDSKASVEDIGSAYAERRAELDASPSRDTASLVLLREANQILSDPIQRAAYDASLTVRAARPSVEAGGEPEATFVQRWEKWIIGAIVLLGIGGWWATRREPPASQRTAPPQTDSRLPVQSAERPEIPPDVKEAGASVEAGAASAASAAEPAAASPATRRSAENVFAEVAPSVVLVNALDTSGRRILSGSGVVIDSGVVLTNCHVAKGGAKLTVKLGEKTMPATIQLADEALDLCRLGVAGLSAPPVVIGNVASLRTGQRVYAIGAPVGLELTISEGIVSALREVDEGTVVQTTAPISPGSSGGGLFDVSGRLVGIMTFQHRYGQNLNFALPADWIGEMRARSAAEAARSSRPVAGRSQDSAPADLILGLWTCRSAITGRAGQYHFERDGALNVATPEGKSGMLKYRVSGKMLQLADDEESRSWMIEELTARRMILHTGGEGRRLVCEQQ